MLKKIFTVMTTILIAFFYLGATETGTGRLKGTVYDEANNESLYAVKIEILDEHIFVFTNPKGEYVLSDIPAGPLKVRVYLRGFKPIEKELTLITDKAVTEDFYLVPDILLQHEVIVTATKTELALGEVPVAAEVIPEIEIRTSNIKNVQDLFAFLPGIQVKRTTGTWGNKGNIRMQGLNANHSLILVDGQRYLGGMGGVDIASIPVNSIEKIEVIKGPSSVLYGSDAIGGVVNVITKSALERKPSFSLSGAAGSSNAQVYEAVGNYARDRFGASFAFTHKHLDGREASTDEMLENIVHGNLEYRFSSRAKFSIKPRYEYTKLELDERTQKRFVLNSFFEWKPDDTTSFHLRGSFFNYKHTTAEKASGWDNNNYEVDADISHLFFNSNLITAGYHLQQEDINDQGKDYTANQTMHSFFLQDQVMIKAFTLVLGGRIDMHDTWGTEFSPKANLMVRLTEGFRLKGSIGKAFRGPNMVKLFGSWRMGPFVVTPNIDLTPERSTGYQLGAQWNLSDSFSAGISYFYNDVKDLIQSVYSRRGRPPWSMTWVNVAEAMTSGIELSFRSSPFKNLVAKAGYTYLDTEDKTTGKELLDRPKHSIFLVMMYKISSLGTDISLNAAYTGKRLAEVDSGREELDPYTTFDLTASQKITRFGRIFIRVNNLFNVKDVYDEYNIYGTQVLGGLEFKY